MSELLATREIIHLLRGWGIGRPMIGSDWMNEAADRMESLEAVNAELMKSLGVFADPSNWGYDRDLPRAWDNRDIRRPADFARNALAKASAATTQPRAADASTPPEF